MSFGDVMGSERLYCWRKSVVGVHRVTEETVGRSILTIVYLLNFSYIGLATTAVN